VALLEDKYKA
jgi:hypothetical protein